MKMKYELKRMTLSDCDAYFATIAKTDPTPVVDLTLSTVFTLGAVAATFPRKGEPNDMYYYLVLDKKHLDVERATKWWNKLRRIEYNGTTYTVLKDINEGSENELVGYAINGQDHKIYRISWNPNSEMMVPLLSPNQDGLELDLYPEYDWNGPVRTEPTA